MNVGVVEAGHDEFSAEIDRFRVSLAGAFRQDVRNCADANNFAVAHSQGLRPGMLGIVTVDAAVQVEDGAGGVLRMQAKRGECDKRDYQEE
jgi:hypothetical protein